MLSLVERTFLGENNIYFFFYFLLLKKSNKKGKIRTVEKNVIFKKREKNFYGMKKPWNSLYPESGKTRFFVWKTKTWKYITVFGGRSFQDFVHMGIYLTTCLHLNFKEILASCENQIFQRPEPLLKTGRELEEEGKISNQLPKFYSTAENWWLELFQIAFNTNLSSGRRTNCLRANTPCSQCDDLAGITWDFLYTNQSSAFHNPFSNVEDVKVNLSYYDLLASEA